MSGWQPISTAPKDGTLVLLWFNGGKYEQAGHRIGKMTEMAGRWFPLVGCTVFAHEWDNFTHWMPLPAPPTTENENRTGLSDTASDRSLTGQED